MAESGSESKPASAIVSTNPRPEDYLTVGKIFDFLLNGLVFGCVEN